MSSGQAKCHTSDTETLERQNSGNDARRIRSVENVKSTGRDDYPSQGSGHARNNDTFIGSQENVRPKSAQKKTPKSDDEIDDVPGKLAPIEIDDKATDISEDGGRGNKKVPRQDSSRGGAEKLDTPSRLLIVSSKIKHYTAIQNALHSNVIFVQYKYESSTLDGILGLVAQNLGTKKVESIALLLHSTGTTIHLCGKDEKVLTKENIIEQQSVRDFFKTLVTNHLDQSWVNARLDFLACRAVENVDGGLIAQEIETIVGVPVGISKEVSGSDIPMVRIGEEDEKQTQTVGELYFRVSRLKGWNANNQQTLAGFEKIRTVGKGAYGTAVLYRKKDDDSLVILKEINLHDLNAGERQLALNEVKVLAMLDHPNIISYYDSFEEDGTVMIEMEYADGGTLAQFLAAQERPMEEKDILLMFQQIVAAIRHIHEHNILHRDLKTANIFLTKEGVVKVGDFGISKLMTTTNRGANTVLGTPYYISPEMCEGKAYNDKSDIWALGCIMYELACLQKTFEGSNLPALVNKIMKGQFAPVKGNYSSEFKNLIRDMLQREPEYRPSANELMYQKLPELMCKYEDPVTDYEDDVLTSSENFGRKRRTSTHMEKRSVLYYLETCSMTLQPMDLPCKIKIRGVAVGQDHVIAVTVERVVYTWGDGSQGQLGHGNLEDRQKPEMVEVLKGKSITKAVCGDGFSVFASDNGIVMTCGDGKEGCLGHGDWCSTSRPRLIEALLSVDVSVVACGLQHVVVVGSDGEVFAWGKGDGGRLGLGNEESYCEPMEVVISEPVVIRDVFCGRDGTMFLSDVGSVLACGNNQSNKLGLNQRQGFLMAMKNIFNKTEVEGQKVPTLVKALARHRVIDISMGAHHSSVLVEPGHIYTFGRNSEGQLGIGNTKEQNAPIEVKGFDDTIINRVQCGVVYTSASTTTNELYFWGMRYKNPPPSLEDSFNKSGKSDVRVESALSGSQVPSSASVSSLNSSRELTALSQANKDGGSVASLAVDSKEAGKKDGASQMSIDVKSLEQQLSVDNVGTGSGADGTVSPRSQLGSASSELAKSYGFRPLSSTPRRAQSANSGKEKEKEKDKDLAHRDDTELLLHPIHILRLDATGVHSPAGETVTLSNFYCHGENLFIQVETTAPPPKRKTRKKKSFRQRISASNLAVPGNQVPNSASSRDGGDEYSSEASEIDTLGTIPAWIKQELASSQDHAEGQDGEDTSEDEEGGRHLLDSSMTSIQINKNLKPGHHSTDLGKIKVTGKNKVAQKVPTTVKENTGSTESGVDVEFTPVEPLSSSSSSETNLKRASRNRRAAAEEAKKVSVPPKKLTIVPGRKISGPSPYKSKLPPAQSASQKPLNKIRAQGRGRGSRPSVPDGPRTSTNENPGKEGAAARGFISEVTLRQREESLQSEMERLRQEKKQTEERLKELETRHVKQKEEIRVESQRQSEERERKLKDEIEGLRYELISQSKTMQDNYNVVIGLQEQLVKLQSEQMRMSAREQRAKSAKSEQSVHKESRVCSLQ